MGGFERTCAEFARQARAREIDAHFVFEGQPCSALLTQLSAAHATWHTLAQIGSLRLGQVPALWQLLRRIRPALIHLHFCEMSSVFFLLARCCGARLIATYHISGESSPLRGIRRHLKRLRRIAIDRSLYRISAVSNAARDKFVGDYLIARDRVRVIYNGTESVAVAPRAPQSPAAGPRVAFVGGLILEKGAHIAIRALAYAVHRLPGIRFCIVGVGPQLAALRSLADELQLQERVAFLGLQQDVPAALAEYDIVVVPSLWKEAFGYVVIEAMAAGCVTIASRVGGILEVITDGENGLLVPPGDAAALSDALVAVWLDTSLQERLRRNAQAIVAQRFSLQRCVGEFWELYAPLPPATR